MKKCTKCKKLKDLKDFGFNKKAKDGRESWCRVCTNKLIKAWQKRNKDKVYKKQKEWVKNNIEKSREKSNKWKRNNRDKVYEYNSKYVTNRRKRDLNFRIRDNIRSRIKQAIKYKRESSRELLGCSIEFLVKYLESKFKKGMTWNNYSRKGWHIDHKKPCSKFDLIKLSEQKKCFNYKNLQPLWAEENLKKGNK